VRTGFGLLLLGLVVAGGPAEAAGPSFVQGGKLAACVDPSFPPMEFVQTPGQPPVGVDVDVIKGLADVWGVKADTISMDFAGLLPGLESKRCDIVISGALLKEERLKTFDASPYLKTGIVMIGRASDKDSYNAYEDFAGKTIAVQAGTSYVDLLTKVNDKLAAAGKPKMTLQTYPKQTDAIQQVLVGRAVASISQDTELAYRDLQQPGQLKVLYAAPEKDQYAAYIRKDPGDAAALKEAIAKLAADGKLKEIAARWKLPASSVEGIGS